ncbi:addiction module HigA family antidote [Rhizobium sp. SG_E_25_P2]|nr:addiction module HigA family antidote [Rhizobium sp. SG_E_25_P2]
MDPVGVKNMAATETTALLRNPHPGNILREDFLEPMALSQNALAKALKVPPRRINEIVLGRRAVTADTDLRLARYFGMSEGFFLGLQTDFDLMQRRRQIESELATIEPRVA